MSIDFETTPNRLVSETFACGIVPRNIVATSKNGVRAEKCVKGGLAKMIGVLRKAVVNALKLDAPGTFAYKRGDDVRTVSYNGHNGQFESIWKERYKDGYEFDTGLLLLHLCRGEFTFYDVGSNWGYFSLLVAASPAFTGKIFSFEPNPAVFADITSLVSQTGTGDRITPVNCGIGATVGELRLQIKEAFKTGKGQLRPDGDGLKVPVKPIDKLDLPTPHVIKIDAEGMELDIFSGALETLKKAKPFLVFENILEFSRSAETYRPLDYLMKRDYVLFIPVVVFRDGDRTVVASYGDPIGKLLAADRNPTLKLIRVNADTRFLFRRQMNLLGCHQDRVGELESFGLSLLDPKL